MRSSEGSIKSDDVRLQGVSICPGIGIGRVRTVDVDIPIPQDALDLSRIAAEQDRYLLQYFMAADRDNERVVQYHDATSPAFLWLLEHIIDQAAKVGREADVAVCGEIASDPRMLHHLLRLGYRSFSIAPATANMVRDVCAKARTQ